MKILLQRVGAARVEVEGKTVSQIDKGYLLLVAIDQEDTEDVVGKMAKKVLNLRVMADGAGKMNLDIRETRGEVLAVSQFTLSGNSQKGNRPSFIRAAEPDKAKKYFDLFVRQLGESVRVATGRFGAYMQVFIQNDGPVTIWLDSELI